MTLHDANEIAQLSTRGAQVATFPTLGTGPHRIVLGPDGNIWWTETGSGTIGSLSIPDRVVSSFGSPNGWAPVGIAVGVPPQPGQLAHIWFVNSLADTAHELADIDPATHAISYHSGLVTGPRTLALGSDRYLWYTGYDSATVAAISPKVTAKSKGPFGDGSGTPYSIAAAPDGNLYFTDCTDGAIDEVDLSTPTPMVTTLFQLDPTAAPVDIASTNGSGPGSFTLFFTELQPNAVGRLDVTYPIERGGADGTVTYTEYPIPTAGSKPKGIVAGTGGMIWFAEGAVDQVSRLNPKTGKITEFGIHP